jgi:hypothetical protein
MSGAWNSKEKEKEEEEKNKEKKIMNNRGSESTSLFNFQINPALFRK